MTVFYFLCYPRGDRTKITVVDLANCVAYERDEWLNVNDLTFQSQTEAIEYAKDLANKHGLEYMPFESRYDSSFNESSYIY